MKNTGSLGGRELELIPLFVYNGDMQENTSNKKFKIGKTQVALLVLCLLQITSLVVIFVQRKENTTLKKQVVQPTIEPSPSSIPEAKNTLGDLTRDVAIVFSGQAEYKDADHSYIDINNAGLKVFQSESLELAYQNRLYHASVQAYKYVSGLKYENGYEGSRWIVTMDEWYRFLTNTRVGKYTGYVYDGYWGEENQYEKTYKVVQLGERKYVVDNTNFQPAGSWDQKYQTYDRQNNQLVVITITFYDAGKNDDLSCYSDVKHILDLVETIISQS